MVRDYSIFCIGEMQSDLQDMGLPNYPRLAFGPREMGLRFGLAQRGLDISLGAPFLWAWRVGLRSHFSNPIKNQNFKCMIDILMGVRTTINSNLYFLFLSLYLLFLS